MRREQKPKVICPVCKSEAYADDEGMVQHGMCTRCYWYLGPDINGGDTGRLMHRTRRGGDGMRHMDIRPRGFWSEAITVREDREWFRRDENEKAMKIDIAWSCGGTDGSLGSVDTAKSFMEALQFAIFTVVHIWKPERKADGWEVIA